MEEMAMGCAAEERKKRPRDEGEDEQVQENAEKLVVSSAEEGKKRPRYEGEDGEGLPEEENEEKELVVSSGEEGKKTRRGEGEDGEGVPAQENAEKKLEVSSAEADPAGEEVKEILPVEASHAEKDKEILADAEVEKEEAAAQGESVPASVVDGSSENLAAIPCEAKIGPKVFTSSMDMFNFFNDLLRAWPLNFNLNKYEHLMLEDLINQGHHEPQKKIGAGIEAFQVRLNPVFYSRCYYILRTDGSSDDFSYRKCVDNILPLPKEFKSPSGDLKVGNKNMGHGGQYDNRGRGGRGGAGRGGGRGGRRGGGGHRRGNRGRGRRF